jgi:hypothetical protein
MRTANISNTRMESVVARTAVLHHTQRIAAKRKKLAKEKKSSLAFYTSDAFYDESLSQEV